jgi:hypothetical protein
MQFTPPIFFAYLQSINGRFPQIFKASAGNGTVGINGVPQKDLSGWGWYSYLWVLAGERAVEIEPVLLLNHQTVLTNIAYLVDKADTERFNMEQAHKGR